MAIAVAEAPRRTFEQLCVSLRRLLIMMTEHGKLFLKAYIEFAGGVVITLDENWTIYGVSQDEHGRVIILAGLTGAGPVQFEVTDDDAEGLLEEWVIAMTRELAPRKGVALEQGGRWTPPAGLRFRAGRTDHVPNARYHAASLTHH